MVEPRDDTPLCTHTSLLGDSIPLRCTQLLRLEPVKGVHITKEYNQ